MCLVIDACCLSNVFIKKDKKHPAFEPVLQWITKGKGRMIYGGTKYNTELGRVTGVLGIVSELSRQRRTVMISSDVVDPLERELKDKIPDEKFDDEHLAALVIASRCHVVCTDDNIAISYLRRPALFTDYCGVTRPSIFRGHKTQKKLCCKEHVVEICGKQ